MKRLIITTAIASCLVGTPLTFANDAHHATGGQTVAQADVVMTSAEVRKVDKAAKKITLKHEDIKNLDMPAMTMVFQVRDAGMLDHVKAGDKVKFSAEKVDGAYIVTGIEGAK
jgi:Cu/Ag efflux protein CusF